MTLRNYLIGMLAGTLLCWLSFIMVIYSINPEQSGAIGLICFYISLFLSLIGTFSLLGFFLRSLLEKHEITYRQLNISFRQGIFFSLLTVISLFMQANKILTWWNTILLIFLLTLLEFFFVAKRKII